MLTAWEPLKKGAEHAPWETLLRTGCGCSVVDVTATESPTHHFSLWSAYTLHPEMTPNSEKGSVYSSEN